MTPAPMTPQLQPGLSFAEFTDVIRVVSCPKHCHYGQHGMDNCNTCGCTGSGVRVRGKFYPNTERGFRAAFRAYKAKP